MIQPKLYKLEEYEAMVGQILSTYSLTAGLSNNVLNKIITKVLSEIKNFPDRLNSCLREEFSIPHYDYSIRKLHYPESLKDVEKARKRFIFEEIYEFSYRMKQIKKSSQCNKNNFEINEKITVDDVERVIGFKLTKAQTNSVKEILKNFKSNISMSRLLQGDVGSGKTMVAFITMLNVILSGYQAAIMAPTEILAQQHYKNFIELVKKLDLKINTELLTSSLSVKQKKKHMKI